MLFQIQEHNDVFVHQDVSHLFVSSSLSDFAKHKKSGWKMLRSLEI